MMHFGSFVAVIGLEMIAFAGLIIAWVFYEDRLVAWEAKAGKTLRRAARALWAAADEKLVRPLKRWIYKKLAEDGIYAVVRR